MGGELWGTVTLSCTVTAGGNNFDTATHWLGEPTVYEKEKLKHSPGDFHVLFLTVNKNRKKSSIRIRIVIQIATKI